MSFSAYKYLLLPSKEQTELFQQWEGSTRWLWNQFLAKTTDQYAKDKKFIWGFELKRMIPEMKVAFPWLKNTPAHALQNVSFDLDKALKRSTGKNRDQGFPKFKSKGRNAGAIKIDQIGTHLKVSNTHIHLPKIGPIKWKYHRPISGELKQVSLTQDCGRWYVSVVCEIPDVPTITQTSKDRTIGLDLGVSSFAILSDGRKIESPQFLKKKLHRLARYQRQMQKRVKASKNREKAKLKIQRCHRDIRNQRNDWLHQESRKLVNQYDIICTEDLKTKQLMEKKDHGKSLNRAIADQGWSMFLGMLEYKTKSEGKIHTKISQWMPSTKTCSCCGTERKMKLSDRVYICENEKCADYLKAKDRDWNAALNIHFWGLMGTPGIELIESSTEGTSGINACGEPSASAESVRTDMDWGSLNQEAACPLGQR